jgi:hypothetical protein
MSVVLPDEVMPRSLDPVVPTFSFKYQMGFDHLNKKFQVVIFEVFDANIVNDEQKGEVFCFVQSTRGCS